MSTPERAKRMGQWDYYLDRPFPMRNENMSETPEGKLKRECRAWMREQGAYVFSPVQTGYGAATIDDLVCWKGKFVGIEYKVHTIPTPRQQVVMNNIRDAGGLAWCIYHLNELQRSFDVL